MEKLIDLGAVVINGPDSFNRKTLNRRLALARQWMMENCILPIDYGHLENVLRLGPRAFGPDFDGE